MASVKIGEMVPFYLLKKGDRYVTPRNEPFVVMSDPEEMHELHGEMRVKITVSDLGQWNPIATNTRKLTHKRSDE